MVLEIAGSGDADLRELVAKDVSINIAGSGDAKVYALENLAIKIAGSGDIGYIGDPEIHRSVAGSGDISQIASAASATVAGDEDDPRFSAETVPAETGTAEEDQ